MFSNGLSRAESERLAILLEEMGETQQIIGKILRHGYESFDPTTSRHITNRDMLNRELGDVLHALDRMWHAGDVSYTAMTQRADEKAVKIDQYLHHQERTGYKRHRVTLSARPPLAGEVKP